MSEITVTRDVTQFTDQELWVRLFQADYLVAYETDPVISATATDDLLLLDSEAKRRYGDDATDRTAGWVTTRKMDHEDMIRWATENIDHLLLVARGEIVG